MSEINKCKICQVADGEDCQLMRVFVDEDGKEIKYCCEHLQKKHVKRI